MKRFFLFYLLIMTHLCADTWTLVEQKFLDKSLHQGPFPHEKMKVLEVDDCKELGRLLAYRFIEWVRLNPEGVIALPTGKTPEAFITYMKYLKENWDSHAVQAELEEYGLSGSFPEMSALKFVQLDEFYAIDPRHASSFTKYVKEHYLSVFGIKEALLMDINTDTNEQNQLFEKTNKFAEKYEEKIREWGGIGFFVGGIGIDGHVAFNQPGSPATSTTRLIKLEYIPAAQSAISFGGMEFTRDKLALTIGMDTIMSNPNAVIILMVAGEGKSEIVRKVVEDEMTIENPGSLLQLHKGTRCYVTKGAAKDLTDRQIEDAKNLALNPVLIDSIVISAAKRLQKGILDLTQDEIESDIRGEILLARAKKTAEELKNEVYQRIVNKFESKIPEDRKILHTGPHHDDVMLSYFGLLPDLIQKSDNLFIYLTSGFNAVTDQFIKERVQYLVENEISDDVFQISYANLMKKMVDAAHSLNSQELIAAESILIARQIALINALNNSQQIKEYAEQLLTSYFLNKIPGEKDSKEMQLLKGTVRESEEDRHMMLHGVAQDQVLHLRSNFYTGDYFNPLPTIENDAKPLLEIIASYDPDIVTVALDPEGTGPDTHYKVLQVVNQALKMYDKNPVVWGYRNVWYQFEIEEASLIFPVDDSQLAQLHQYFMDCYTTQKDASFPALEFDGPFSEYAVIKQREQLDEFKMLLGEDFFINHHNPKIANAQGLLFIKEMSKQQLHKEVSAL